MPLSSALPVPPDPGAPAQGLSGPRVLIADDSAVNRQFLSLLLAHAGYRTLTARDGLEAVEACRMTPAPDLVLMDVHMPRMDGREATRQIKMESGDRFLPVVFVTALSDQDALADCVAAGGDDFVSKPVQRAVLLARIKAQLRIRKLYWEQYEQRRELAYYREAMEWERRLTEQIFRSLKRSSTLEIPQIRYCQAPLSVFNGDVLLAAATPAGSIRILVGDFTGHGLSAAVGALPTSDIFYSMTAKDFALADVLAEINRRLLALLPTGMFFALCVLEIYPTEARLGVWNGGLPDVLIRRASGDLERLSSQHLPLGIVPSTELERALDWRRLYAQDRLFVYTDGVTETEATDGSHYGLQRLEALISSAPDTNLFERVLQDLARFRAGAAQHDDLTLLQYEHAPLARQC